MRINVILKYRRSFSPNYFRYFEDIPNIKLFSLQKDDDLSGNEKKGIPENIHLFNNFDNHDEAFLDTISLIKNLDLVIYYKENSGIQRIKEAKFDTIYNSLHTYI